MADDKGHGELNSWKEIADFLGVSVRTAQRYERELGLPVRRTGGRKGQAVVGRHDELTVWKARTVLPHLRWWQGVSFLRIYSIVSTAIILVLAMVIALDRMEHYSVGKPHNSHWVDAVLHVADQNGREVWHRAFDGAASTDGVYVRYHGDLDGDGRVETLVPFVPWQRDSKGGFLYCFSQEGKELWRIEPKKAVADREQTFSTLYVLRSYTVFKSPQKDGTLWTAAAFVHHYDYPSVVIVVDSKGKARGEYWHSGHLNGIHSVDLDNDGKDQLVLCGSKNVLSRAVLLIFDPLNVGGAEALPAGHPQQLRGFTPGTEKATVIFERSRLNRLRDHYNYAYWIGPATAADRSFQVTVSEALDRTQGYLTYTIRPDLTLSSVVPSDSLRNTYLEHSLKNPSIRPFGEPDLEELRRGYTIRWGNSSHPVASASK
jgi:hypothetical protein